MRENKIPGIGASEPMSAGARLDIVIAAKGMLMMGFRKR
jgi:hypothetical protein